MKGPIISHSKVLDYIQLEDEYNFSTLTTIGLDELGDFYLEIEFLDLKQEQFEILAKLSKQSKEIRINSNLIKREKYNIIHIVVTGFTANSLYEMTWRCLSDEPSTYLNFNS